jgi:hypothetical protein
MSATRPETAARWSFWIDRGGTFTDVVARHPDGRLVTHKLLSENPERYADAATAGIRAVLAAHGEALESATIAELRMGTTVATNALLERRGEPTLLAITSGFGDALRIGDPRVQWRRQADVEIEQTRPRLFADTQGIAKAGGDRQQGRLAAALEQRIGRYCRAHAHLRDRCRLQCLAMRGEQRADAGRRRIGVALRVLRQQLVRDQCTVRTPRDDVGERTAAVDPERPVGGWGANAVSHPYCRKRAVLRWMLGDRAQTVVATVQEAPTEASHEQRQQATGGAAAAGA